MRIDERYILCDWLTVSQNFPEGIQQFNSDMYYVVDTETGEVKYKRGTPKHERASWDTSVRISSDGYRLVLSGNIGRLGRPDNVFGYDLDECKRRANKILRSLELPEFTDGQLVQLQSKNGKAKSVYTGALISRVDLTCNFSLGDNSKDFIYWLGVQKLGRTKVSAWGDGETVYWGAHTKGKSDGKYVTSKAYTKAAEIRVRIKEKKRRKETDFEHVEYLTKLADWCEQSGIVRHETLFAERFLNQKGLKYWHTCTHKKLLNHYQQKLKTMTDRTEIEKNIEPMSRVVAGTYHAYMNRENMRNMPKPTFYRHRTALLKHGVDIAMPPKVVALKVRVKYLECLPATPPEFYEFERPKLSLVN